MRKNRNTNKKIEKKDPTVSVVIPAFNEETYLKKTLESIRKQSHQPIEIIVVDNNSTDKTAKIARTFGAIVIQEKKAGYVYAVNTGVRKATGEVVACTDADTLVPRDWVKRIAQAFCDRQVIAASTKMKLVGSPLFSFLTTYIHPIIISFHFMVGKPHLIGSSMALRKNVFMRIGGFDPAFKNGADIEYGLRVKQYGNVMFLSDITVLSSARRFTSGMFSALCKYFFAYVKTVWFHKPDTIPLKPIR